MPIKLEIIQETPDEVVNAIFLFANRFKAQGAVVPAPANDTPAPVQEAVAQPKASTRKKAPAAEAVIDQPKQADIEDVTGKPANDDGPQLTVEDARERMKQFAADGHMDQVSAALEHFGVKKVSDIDPDAKGKPSAKFGAFVAKIDDLVAALPVGA